MSKPTYHLILIDPEARTVLTVESSGTLEHAQQLVQTDYLESKPLTSGTDLLLFAEEPKQNAAMFCIGTGLVIRGRAIVAHGGENHFGTPRMSIEIIRDAVTFTPGTTTHNPH